MSLRELLEKPNLLIHLGLTRSGEILYSGPGLGEIPSYDEAQYQGYISDYIHPDDQKKLYGTLLGGDDQTPHLSLRLSATKKAPWTSFQFRYRPHALDSERYHLFGAINEESALLKEANSRLMDELHQQIVARERSEFAKNRFLANMNHELRTPLTAILGLSEALELGLYGDFDEEQVSAFRTINQCGQSLLSLINDILDVTKLESGSTKLCFETLQANDLVTAILRLYRKQACKKGVTVRNLCQDRDLSFSQDRRALKQILSHLLSNAIKFTKPETEVKVSIEKRDEKLILQVEDQGVGLDPEQAKLLFQPFRQLDQGLARHHGGAGLGLNLVKKLVNILNGNIEFELSQSGGTLVRVTLDFRAANSTGEQLAKKPQGEGVVLIVDDHEATCKLLEDTFSSWGFETIQCHSIRDFQQVLSQARPEIVIMDGKLPDGNGIEGISWLRQRPQFDETSVIFVSALDEPDMFRAGMSSGAQAYLEKPILQSKLASCVNAVYLQSIL